MSKVASINHHNKTNIAYPKASINANGKKMLVPVSNAEVTGPGTHDEILNFPAISANPSFGNLVEYAINPESDVLKDLSLVFNISALTTTGGTYRRFVNDASFWIQRIEYVQGSETLQTIYGDALSVFIDAHYSTEEKNRIYQFMNIGSSTQRNTNASSTQTVEIPMYSFIKNCHIPLFLCNQIRVRVWLQPLTTIVQTDGTVPTCSINSTYLRGFARVLDSVEKENMVTQYKKNGSMQWRFLDARQQIQSPQVSGGTSYDVQLNSFSGHVSHLFFYVRNQSDVNTALGNTPDNFQAWNTFFLKNSAGEIITKWEHESAFNRSIYSVKYIKGDMSTNQIGFYAFNTNPEKSLALGSQEGSYFFGANGEILNLKFSTAQASPWVVDVIAFTYNTIELSAHGQLKKID